ncbi:ThuA domain-containing protein [Tundrisphaera sp. TA3]|uniref:ThuA domain-containing protein n=1 Tax=Tundrisphaera sp. TA3 TaxID=3435775 RepID=UPI003EB733AB
MAEASPATPKIRVRVWCEGGAPRSVYPRDIDGALSEFLKGQSRLDVKRGRLDQPDSGVSDAALDATDVLIWWGRLRHADLPDHRAAAIADRVRAGKLGFVALHASCGSKPFVNLMGTSCEPGGWRDNGRPERVTIAAPDHEIARGVAPFTIPKTSMYLEPFQVPSPETVVLLSTFSGGETFRSGLTWTVGRGRVAYFRPGNEAFPVLFHPAVRRVVANAAIWAAPTA